MPHADARWRPNIALSQRCLRPGLGAAKPASSPLPRRLPGKAPPSATQWPPAGGQSTPMSYAVAGRHFVVTAAGGHRSLGTKTGDYVIAYALPT